MTQALPTGSAERKAVPLARGVLDYFPAALAEVARLSQAGNDKHNPGEELHHARGKSTDHADCIIRHLVDRGIVDPDDGFLHEVKVAWRALALLQESLEARGAPLARGAREPTLCDLVKSCGYIPVLGSGALPDKIERPWITSPGEQPALADSTAVDVLLEDGSVHRTRVGDVFWRKGLAGGTVACYRIVD